MSTEPLNTPSENASLSTPLSFTESAESLDTILKQFREGNLSPEASLTLFEQGVGHLKACQKILNKTRGQVQELSASLEASGEQLTRPFEKMHADDDTLEAS